MDASSSISRTAAIAGLCLVFAAAGCGDEASPTGPSDGNLRVAGRVLDFRTGAGVASASITVGATQTTSDQQGNYEVSVLSPGRHDTTVNGAAIASVIVTPSGFRGDLLVDDSGCGSRYGIIVDARTLRPIAGAQVTIGGSTTTGADGWYRLDAGCPSSSGFNTIFMIVSHPGYEPSSTVAGRGVHGVLRRDIALRAASPGVR